MAMMMIRRLAPAAHSLRVAPALQHTARRGLAAAADAKKPALIETDLDDGV